MELRGRVGASYFAFGILMGFLFMGCAGFGYHYYGLKAESYEGTLLGPKPKNDIPFASCSPTPQKQSPCVVVLADEFFRMKQDFLETKQLLKECQAAHL